MNSPKNGQAVEDALRAAQLEINMLREQLRKATGEAKAARSEAEKITDPAKSPAPASAEEILPNESASVAEACGNRRVLCVEDNEANFQLIETILTDRPGTDLTWAENGRKGLEIAAASRPQLVLLDLDLPDMHGSEVLANLRAKPETAETPVIVISADATPSQIERMLAGGAHDYITKPFEIRRFLLMFDEIFPGK
ncbi:MAG TPA: response regulator [Chthoniobacterales bacterium]|nr:response regulator [Chthoniobacterales bacterium]